MNKKGFTIVELMVTMVIMSIIIGLVYSSFNTIVSDVKSETKSIESIMDTMVGLEIIRLDIEHAGFGLATDEQCGYPVRQITADSNPPGGCSKQDKTTTNLGLVIRSTINTSNTDTYGWFYCDDGNRTGVRDQRGDKTNNYAVLLNIDKTHNFSGSVANCPAGPDDFLGYPYDNGGPATQCDTQYCNKVTYRLSTAQDLGSCYGNSRNLLRVVGAGNGVSILQCSANWALRFSLDTNGDGTIDQQFSDKPWSGAETAANIRSQLKAVHLYALIQDSQFDPDYNGDYNATKLTIDGVNLTKINGDIANPDAAFVGDIANFIHFRWKVLKISAKPMNL